MSDAPNPAIVPEPEQPKPKTYLVCGPHRFLGHEPGQTFTAVLDPDQEARALRRGSIQAEAAELARLGRDDLNDLARELGVQDPEQLPNKPAVIAAIEAATAAKEA